MYIGGSKRKTVYFPIFCENQVFFCEKSVSLKQSSFCFEAGNLIIKTSKW